MAISAVATAALQLLLLLLLHRSVGCEAAGRGFVKVELLRLENPRGLLKDGSKCDAGKTCDPIFTFDVMFNGQSHQVTSGCNRNKNSINFTIGTEEKFENPLKFAFDSVPKEVKFTVKVQDCFLSYPNDVITDMGVRKTDLKIVTHSVNGKFKHMSDYDNVIRLDEDGKVLTLKIWIECDEDYYGENCKHCFSKPPICCTSDGYTYTASGDKCDGNVSKPIDATNGKGVDAGMMDRTRAAADADEDGDSNKTDETKQMNSGLIALLSAVLIAVTILLALALLIIHRRGDKISRYPISSRGQQPQPSGHLLYQPPHQLAAATPGMALRIESIGTGNYENPIAYQTVKRQDSGVYEDPTAEQIEKGQDVYEDPTAEQIEKGQDVYEDPVEPSAGADVEAAASVKLQGPKLPARRTPMSRSFSKQA